MLWCSHCNTAVFTEKLHQKHNWKQQLFTTCAFSMHLVFPLTHSNVSRPPTLETHLRTPSLEVIPPPPRPLVFSCRVCIVVALPLQHSSVHRNATQQTYMKTIVDNLATLAVIRSIPRLLSSLLFLRPLRLHVFGVLRPSSFLFSVLSQGLRCSQKRMRNKQKVDDVALVFPSWH